MTLLAACLMMLGTLGSESSPLGLPGGYATAEIGKEVEEAAEFAVRQKSVGESEPLTLTRISQAEIQIVAGVNYRLVLIVRRTGVDQKAKATVFRDLNGQFSLKSWEWLGSQ